MLLFLRNILGLLGLPIYIDPENLESGDTSGISVGLVVWAVVERRKEWHLLLGCLHVGVRHVLAGEAFPSRATSKFPNKMRHSPFIVWRRFS